METEEVYGMQRRTGTRTYEHSHKPNERSAARRALDTAGVRERPYAELQSGVEIGMYKNRLKSPVDILYGRSVSQAGAPPRHRRAAFW